jgi:hypothetical protein
VPKPDTSAIDAALVNVLYQDTTLKSLVPDGVYMDEAPPNAQRFVIVALADAVDNATYDAGRAFEEKTYTVVAKMLSTAGGDIKGAAARIDVLLEDAALTVTGYADVRARRERPIRETDVDTVDPSLRWFHRGGEYRVHAAIT